MFELIQVGEKSYYINSPAKIGLYKQNESDVYLIDSGNDKDAGRKVKKILDENGWVLKGIINTHSNADHIGGNRYLQQQCGCKIYAKGIEADFTKHPILEPSFLYGGYPFMDMRHKFLLAEESDALDICDASFPKELEVIPLPGHFFDMVGIRTPDNTVFLADCISSKTTLEKYQIGFIYDVKSYIETLDLVNSMEGEIFVPAHAEAAKNLTELVEFNRRKAFEIADTILSLCAQPQTFESLLKGIFDRYNLTMNVEQYILVGSTVRSYLSWLKDSGKLNISFENNYFYWHLA
ncbi:MAG: MBL fold metallo-hydrolase [Oscillospiraceae bacterium]|nr:MBL fold metallo-hydrolase [Oscillospiraceae bacterium]